MRLSIESLTVRGFRGIPGKETLNLAGNNGVVVGPNGTGKSTLTQALEFLLTGQVSALTGAGTGRINRREHIPNHNVDPREVYVEVQFADEGGESLTVRREFTSSSSIEASRRPESLERFLTLADQGLALLTREELLELVVTTPGTRKDQLQQLLDLTGIDERRRQLKRLARKANEEADRCDREITRAEERLQQNLGIRSTDESTVRTAVNNLRAELGGDGVDSLGTGASFRRGLNSPAEQATHPLQRSSVRQNISWLHDWLTGSAADFDEKRQELVECLRALQADRKTLERVSQLELVRQGQEMVDDEAGACPLCLAEYKPGEVEARLEARRRRLSRIEEQTDQLQDLSAEIRREADDVARNLDRVRDQLEAESLGTSLEPLVVLHGHMTNLLDALDCDLTEEVAEISPGDFSHDIDTSPALEAVESLQTEAERLPGKSELQEAWDALAEAGQAYDTVVELRQHRAEYTRVAEELELAHQQFLRSRDAVLGSVYDSIAERFADFYTRVNPDEREMDPGLNPTATGVEFSVGFYGGGEHPPHALHSEGHQDSMGVCLFLALADQFSPLEYTPVMLDDVVMSVDEGHRQRVADVLADDLSRDFQFLITTHDERWATQLVDSGVVEVGNVHAFEGWSPTEGPARTDFDA